METNSLYLKNMDTTFYGRILQDIMHKDGFSNNIIENYNNEVKRKIPELIESTKIPVSNGEVTFENVTTKPPYEYIGGKEEPLTPLMARMNTTPYFAKIEADLIFTPSPVGVDAAGQPIYRNEDLIGDRRKKIQIGSIPAMLGSDLCHLNIKNTTVLEEKEKRMEMGECFNDPLGYFIIKSERLIVTQENLRNSTFLMYPHPRSGDIAGWITCPTQQGTTVVSLIVNKHSCLKILLQHLNKNSFEGLPIFLVFKLLGLEPDQAMERIYEFTKPEYRTRISFEAQPSFAELQAIPVNTAEGYIAYVQRLREKIDTNKTIKEEDVIPNIINDLFSNINEKELKITHLAMYCAKMFEWMIGERKLDDRDSWANKQLITAGFSITKLFKCIWWQMMNKIKSEAATLSGLKAVKDIYMSSEIANQFQKAFGPSGWGVSNHIKKENITDSLKRETPLSVYSQITHVNTPMNRQSKVSEVRSVHPSQIGYLCLYDSPEGENVGLTKSLACSCYISLERDVNVILLTVGEGGRLEMFVTQERENKNQVPLLVNGIIRGWCDPSLVIPELKDLRRSGALHKDTCIFHNPKDNTVEIYCDGGRPTRPLFVVDESDNQLVIVNKKLEKASLDILIKEGCIEYVDAREQEYVLISQTYNDLQENYKNFINGDKYVKFAYCEIDPVAIFSISASLVPMAHRQAGPRTTYQAGMFKQALGQFHSMEHKRFDTSFKMIYYPTKAIFQNDSEEVAGLNYMPTGTTVQVAIYAHPDNPEDGIVLKEEAVKYGNIFDMSKKITVTTIAKTPKEYTETFERPPIKPGEPEGKYDHIDEFGLPKIDSYIRQGDCIIGKVRRHAKDGEVVNASEYAGIGGEGYVDRILITTNNENNTVVRVKIRKNRKYIPGDKAASRYSMKGTISKIIPARDLPRIADGPNKGMVPDIFVNPHSYPSRMTLNNIIEIKTTKAALIAGKYINSTTFRDFEESMEFAEKTLGDYGLDIHGYENFEMPDGTKVPNKIFAGPCYYQALRHHVSDKIQMRARGGIKPDTRQPVAGRSKEGGLRVGEMERDALISHGASAILRERMCDESDCFNLPICGTCGTIAIINHITGVYTCKLCGDKAEFGIIRIPYVMKLLLHYLNASNIHMTFKTEKMFKELKRMEEGFLK
jgi:DNA-directed RNA polymerase II subunit RPB2